MGFESGVHRANFDAVDASPVRYIVITQGHYDHVGGIDTLRDPDTEVVAQANWQQWRDDNERLAALPGHPQRLRLLRHGSPPGIAAIQRRFGKKLPRAEHRRPPTSSSRTA